MDDGLFIEDDDDIHQIGVVDKDFHKVNKKTYHFQIDYDNSIGYYSTRLGVNVVYLPIGYYILAFEMFFSDKIDNNNITVDCLSGTLQILSNLQNILQIIQDLFLILEKQLQDHQMMKLTLILL